MSLENIVELRKKPEYSGKLITVGMLSLGLLQSEFQTVELALSYLKKVEPALKLAGAKNKYIMGLAEGSTKTANFLHQAGNLTGSWMFAGIKYPQFATNVVIDGLIATGDLASTAAEKTSSLASLTIDKLSSLIPNNRQKTCHAFFTQ